ncbi:glycoside hydrolase superfamily [Daedaleopsis nitida]|nr:glycoside hydrolase superfamily [Daedaleopsis nitida]
MTLRLIHNALYALVYLAVQVTAFDMSRSDNLAVYWGQGTGPDLMDICNGDYIDTVPIAFVVSFDGKKISYNLSGNCDTTIDTSCQFIASAIDICQKNGKIVTISIGGATGSITLQDAQQAEQFAEAIHDTFLAGNGSFRPFGDAVLDGIDLDLESGTSENFVPFVNKILDYSKTDGRKYYITAAPQCPFPDAYQKAVLNAAHFDAVYVQFYNNIQVCGLQKYPELFNYDEWHNWATGDTSVNKDLKIYIGAPASAAAGKYGVDADTLAIIVQKTQSNYTSFGGVMLWDAYEAQQNDNFDQKIKQALIEGGAGAPTNSSSSISGDSSTVSGAAPSSSSDASATAPSSGAGESSESSSSSAVPPPSGTTSATTETDMSTATATGAQSRCTPRYSSGSMPTRTTSASSTDSTVYPTDTATMAAHSGSDYTSVPTSTIAGGSETSPSVGACSTPTASSGGTVNCSGVPEWKKSDMYNRCDTVQDKGKLYWAKLWVSSNEPDTFAEAWEEVGECSTSSTTGSETASASGTVANTNTNMSSKSISSGTASASTESQSAPSPTLASSSKESSSSTGTTSSSAGTCTVTSTSSDTTSATTQTASVSIQPARRVAPWLYRAT